MSAGLSLAGTFDRRRGAPVAFREVAARRYIRVILYLITFLSCGNFNPFFFGRSFVEDPRIPDDGLPQQYVIISLWLLLIAFSFSRGALAMPLRMRGLMWPALFVVYVMITPLWSDYPMKTATKAGAFLICSIGVWRLASIISVKDVLDIVTRTLGVLVVASAIMIIVDPVHGIVHDFRTETGDFEDFWRGVYAQKQELGMMAGEFAFLLLMQILNGRNLVLGSLGLLLAVVIEIGSGSRGGALTALLAPIAIIVGRRHPKFFAVVLGIILADLVVALLMITQLAITGSDYVTIRGQQLDFTQRSYIWQYAIGLWTDRPFFGYGLNGFWTNPDILWGYLRVHGWVLDNFHNGYLTILVETGLFGMGLFIAIVWTLYSRLRVLLRGGSNETLEIALGLILITFTINITETVFLRSTNFGQIMFSFLLINICSPDGRRTPAPHNELSRRIIDS
jgi:exopolysaccharide production protein ExoQ